MMLRYVLASDHELWTWKNSYLTTRTTSAPQGTIRILRASRTIDERPDNFHARVWYKRSEEEWKVQAERKRRVVKVKGPTVASGRASKVVI